MLLFDFKGCPIILNQSSWNARPFNDRNQLKPITVSHIVLNRIETLNPIQNQQDCIKVIKAIQDYHMDKSNWSDIGYNFIICGDNDDQQEIYKGRGWKYIGAHCLGYNDKSLGKEKYFDSFL